MAATKKNNIVYAFVNGQFVPKSEAVLPANDLGLLRGYAIFDLFRIQNGVPLFLADYLDRFYRSAKAVNLSVPHRREELTSIIHQLIVRNEMVEGTTRLLLTAGNSPDGTTVGQPNFVILNESPIPPAPKDYVEGVRLALEEFGRPLPTIKHVDYLHSFRLKPQLAAKNFADVLYAENGYITESSRSNFFLIEDGKVYTPDEGILLGITRKKIIEIIKKMVLEIKISPLSVSKLATAQEAFICSTIKQVLPITAVGQQSIGSGSVGEITQQISREFTTLCKHYISEHNPINV